MNLKATLEERESKKGTKYLCIVIKLTDNLEKVVFPDQAEIEVLKLKYGK